MINDMAEGQETFSRSKSDDYQYHQVSQGDRENKGRNGLRTAISGEEERGAANQLLNTTSKVDTLRIDLQKVAYKLNVPLSALLRHFQSDPSSEHCKKNRDRDLTKLEVTLGGDPLDMFQDPIEGTPLVSPSVKSSEMKLQPKRSLNDSRDFGTTVVIANHGSESPNLAAADAASASASIASDEDNLKVELIGNKRDEKLPYIAYLMHDTARGATVMAIPNLPPPPAAEPSDMDEELEEPTEQSCCFCFDPPSSYHESTSAIGEVSCFDFTHKYYGKGTVVKSVTLYSDGAALYLQVQRRMPYWGIPCLLTGMFCSALIPTLYRELSGATNGDHSAGGEEETVGSAASHVWWALGELMVSTALMAVMLKVKGKAWLSPWKSVLVAESWFSLSNTLLLIAVVADVSRHISWSFIINDVAQGPTQILHSSHPLWLVGYRMISSSLLLLGEIGGSALALIGNIIASQTLNGFSDWNPDHGFVAGMCSGISTAAYLLCAQKLIANQPTVGLVWVCKCVNIVAALVVVLIKGDTDFFSAPFMGGSGGVKYSIALAFVGVGRDVLYLIALKALHSLPVSTSMVVDAVLAILFSHWFLDDAKSFGDLEYGWILPGLCVAVAGMGFACYVGLKERTFSEVDLTNPELTRKTARPPPKLTCAALGVQQQRAKSNPPIMWEYSPPPMTFGTDDPSPPIYPSPPREEPVR